MNVKKENVYKEEDLDYSNLGVYDIEIHKEKLRLAEIDEFRELGHEEGLKEGLEKGKQEGTKQTKEETAKKMLQEGLDISIISRCTDLSIEEVENLKKGIE